jgi:uncharacterized membrane protein YeiH
VVFGWVFAGHMLGAAVAASGAGVTRDLLSSYVPAFLMSGAFCLLAALAALAIPSGPAAARAPTPQGARVAA